MSLFMGLFGLHLHQSVTDLACENSCPAAAGLISRWEFGGRRRDPPPHLPAPHSRPYSATLQGTSKLQSASVQPFEKLCHIPFQRTGQQQRSLHVVELIEERLRQNFFSFFKRVGVGVARAEFVPSSSCLFG